MTGSPPSLSELERAILALEGPEALARVRRRRAGPSGPQIETFYEGHPWYRVLDLLAIVLIVLMLPWLVLYEVIVDRRLRE